VGAQIPSPFVQVPPVQTLQTSHGPADETTIFEPLPTTVQACAGGAAAMGATIAEAVDMAVTSHAASFFISCPFVGRPSVSIGPGTALVQRIRAVHTICPQLQITGVNYRDVFSLLKREATP
jgi:hypothetical protein